MNNLFNSVLRSNTKIFIVFLLLGLLCYFPSLKSHFKVVDDLVSIVDNKDIQSFDNLGKVFTASFFKEKTYYRPLVSVSFMLEYHFFKLNTFYYNLDNLLIHILSSIIVFFMISRLLSGRLLGFTSGLLFLIHPIHWEQICNIPGRAILLCGLFFLLAFHFFLLAVKDKELNLFYCFLSMICFVLSLLAKESAAVFPLLVISYIYFPREKIVIKKSSLRILLALYFAVFGLYLILRKILGMTSGYGWYSSLEMIFAVITFLKSALIAFKKFVIPSDFFYDHSTRLFTTWQDAGLWATLLVWSSVIGVIIILRKRISPLVYFLLNWIMINLLIVCQIIPIKISTFYISTAEHFYYLPAVAIFALMSLAGQWLYEKMGQKEWIKKQVVVLVFISIYVFFISVTIEQSIYANQQIAMFKRSLSYNPDNLRVRVSLGLAYGFIGLYKEAESEFRQVLDEEPWDSRARIALGKALCDQNRCLEGIAEYEKVTDPGPSAVLLRANLRISYNFVIDEYKKRLEKEKNNPALHYSLGVMYSKTDRLKEAMEQFEKAVSLDPHFSNALFNLASGYALRGEYQKAIEYYQRVLAIDEKIDENDILAYQYMAMAYTSLGQKEQAQQMLAKFEELKPILEKLKVKNR